MMAPYLSVVVCSRNDDHGGNLLGRMQVFIDGLAQLCTRHQLPTELVLVEWNPPSDRPSLSEVLSFPEDNSYFATRIVVVPQSLHNSLRNSASVHLFQMIAKNVGIARARGDFVLTTNVDLLFSSELLRFLSSKSLLKGYYYRADRFDVPADVPRGNIEDELSFCRANVLRINKRDASYDLKTGETFWIYPPQSNSEVQRHNPLGWGMIGMLLLVSWYGEHARGLRMPMMLLSGQRARRSRRRLRSAQGVSILTKLGRYAPHPFRGAWPAGILDTRIQSVLAKRRRGRGPSLRAAIRSGIRLTVAQLPRRPALNVRLDTNASGDFVLMSRQDWVGLRGYPEFQTFSMHLDSLLLYQAYYSGMREIILPYPVYHMTHTAGWGLGAEQSSLVGRLDVFGVPYLSYARFLQIVEKLSKTKDKHFNGLNWGLVDQQLPESGPSPKEISTLARSESTGNARA